MAKASMNLGGLEKLSRNLKKKYTLRVGIIGDKAKTVHDSTSSLTNADLGTIHEQPDRDGKKIPRRSFLEEPLREKLGEEISKNKKSIFKQIFKNNDTEQFLNELGAKALDIINGAFETQGYGAWKSLTVPYQKRKEKLNLSPHILTATSHLRHTVDFKVIKND